MLSVYFHEIFGFSPPFFLQDEIKFNTDRQRVNLMLALPHPCSGTLKHAVGTTAVAASS